LGFFSRLLKRAQAFTFSPRDPGYWIHDWLGSSSQAASGVRVTPDTALRASAVFAAVKILAESVAQLPLILYRRRPDGGKERAFEHPLYPLLHDLPAADLTSFELREQMQAHLALRGNAYARLERDGAGRVQSIEPVHPDTVTPYRLDSGRLAYSYRPSGSTGGRGPTTFLAGEGTLLHVRGLSFDGLSGVSPITYAREAIGLGMAAEEFGSRFFAQNARPGGVLEHPGKLKNEERDNLKRSWEDMHSGLANSHRVAVLEEGMKWQAIGLSHEDAQYLDTRKFQIAEIARIFRVPPHMLGDLDRATFSNIEQQSLEFVIYSLQPWLVRWEQALTRDLLTPAERTNHFIEFLIAGLVRGDLASRYQAYATGRQWGWLSVNDIRSLENLNPVAGGDVFISPMNMLPAGSLPAPQKGAPDADPKT
jgi:HK97 family phage portal protein